MKRRDFLRVASGGVAAAAAVGSAEAATSNGPGRPAAAANTTTTTAAGGNGTNTTTTSGGLPGAGTTKTVAVGPGGDFVFEPETVYIQPGATIEWVWKSDFHNIVPGEIPQGAEWEGTPGGPSTTYDTGYTYSHTFTQTGTYNYWCQPHKSRGMIGDVVVNESGQPPGAGGGGGGGGGLELNPEEMGVPFQAHYVGLATLLMVTVTLVYNLFVLKYGESRHASAPNKQD
ncbi:MAG: plastocyanin/azurin family copper-binding protein [Halobacteriaceae archaeon]